MEAVGVMQRAEARCMKAGLGVIPKEDIDSGKIGPYLEPEDYHPHNVSTVFPLKFLVIPVSGICQAYAITFSRLSRRTPGIRLDPFRSHPTMNILSITAFGNPTRKHTGHTKCPG